jgi:hypothetical protein
MINMVIVSSSKILVNKSKDDNDNVNSTLGLTNIYATTIVKFYVPRNEKDNAWPSILEHKWQL